MPLNVPLLREIQKQILEKPNTFFMRNWIRRKKFEGSTYINDEGLSTRYAECGTVGCIAGTACLIMEREGKLSELNGADDIKSGAIDLLGLKDVGNSLFYVDNWDCEIRKEYREAPTAKCRAVAACKQIDLYIEQHKGE
jgi:hypothetical protein